MQYPAHITTYWIHLLVFSHAQIAGRMEFKTGINERERRVFAHGKKMMQIYVLIWHFGIIMHHLELLCDSFVARDMAYCLNMFNNCSPIGTKTTDNCLQR